MRTYVSAWKTLNTFFLAAITVPLLCSCGEVHSDWRSEYQTIVDKPEAEKGDDVPGLDHSNAGTSLENDQDNLDAENGDETDFDGLSEENTDIAVKASEMIASESQNAYEGFLKGKEKIYFDIYDSDTHNDGFVEGCLLNEFLENRKARNTELEMYEYYDLQYAYIDCGQDGIPELVLKYMYTGEMSDMEGDYEFTDVIKYIDGRLELCAETLSHYRGNETVNESGIIASGFIDHAGANVYYSYSGVDENGRLHDLMDSMDTIGEAIPNIYNGFIEELDLSGIEEQYGDLYYDITIISTEINFGNLSGETIYSYALQNETIEPDWIINQFEAAGVAWYEYDEYERMINQVIEEFGLSEAQFYGNEPDYKNL